MDEYFVLLYLYIDNKQYGGYVFFILYACRCLAILHFIALKKNKKDKNSMRQSNYKGKKESMMITKKTVHNFTCNFQNYKKFCTKYRIFFEIFITGTVLIDKRNQRTYLHRFAAKVLISSLKTASTYLQNIT